MKKPSDGPAETGPLANASSRQLLRNFLTGYFGLGIAVLLSLFLTPIVLHHVGSQGYGLWIVITTVGGYVGFVGAGVETAAVQFIAAATAVGDTERLKEVVATSRAFFLISGSVASLIIVGLFPLVGDVFHVGHGLVASARFSLLLMAIITGAGMMTNIPQTVLNGCGRVDKSALAGLFLAVIFQGGQIAVVLLGGGLIGLFVVSATQTVLSFAALQIITRRSKLIPPGRRRPTFAMLCELMRSGRRNVTVGIGGTIAYNLDAVIVGVILPVGKVVPYDLALSTANFTRSVSTAGTNLLTPTYSHAAALDDTERQFKLWSRSVLFSMAITIPMVIALISYGQALLHLWVGHVPAETYEVLVVLNIVLFLQLPGHQSFIFLTGAGRNQTLARLSLGPALINLALSIGATYWLGPVGPAIGSLPQVVILDFIILPILCCRTVRASFRRYLREALSPLVPSTIVASVIALILVSAFGRKNEYGAPFECAAICLGSWAALAPVLLRHDPALRRLLTTLRHKEM